jgi:hypothetical protein
MAATGASVAADGTATLTFGSAAEAIAVTGATANPVGVAVATIVFSLAPTSTSANDTTQGCGGPWDAPGAGGQANSTSGTRVASTITPRPDLPPLSGGRSGERVKGLTGPPNSASPGGGGRIFITDKNGNVVVDVTRGRAKPVVPGQGFGDKRAPTAEEERLLDQIGK